MFNKNEKLKIIAIGAHGDDIELACGGTLAKAIKQGHEVRIFLVSSIFGGQGASGFPSIARLIRKILEQKGIQEGVYIGGALMLPYFKFPKPRQ